MNTVSPYDMCGLVNPCGENARRKRSFDGYLHASGIFSLGHLDGQNAICQLRGDTARVDWSWQEDRAREGRRSREIAFSRQLCLFWLLHYDLGACGISVNMC